MGKFVKTEDCNILLVNDHSMGILANIKHNKKRCWQTII